MKNLKWLSLALLLSVFQFVRADEGMWIPMLIEKYHIDDMKEAGLELSAEDIYSINEDCLMDAIVIFGRGCTGEMISSEGLVLTNHHCGEEAIHAHSTIEHDYLTYGYWAQNRNEELPNEELSVTYLRYMEDVSAQVNDGLEQGMDPQERTQKIERNMGHIIKEATSDNHFTASVKPFYYGNAYFLFVYEKFNDVRLVGAPPSAVGNFGADNDNWMWPRHTGDFSLFRVYADADNQPAEYSVDNKPYKPRRHLEVNLSGIEENDYTMILGYPASTTRYLYSEAVRSIVETSLPLKVELRTNRLEIFDRHMKQDELVRIQYAHKYRRISNAWKKWQGMILGLNLNKVVELKKGEEIIFQEWVEQDGERIMKYENILSEFDSLYAEKNAYMVAVDLYSEAVNAVEVFRQVEQVKAVVMSGLGPESMESQLEGFFRDFYLPIDRDVFVEMMEVYADFMPEEHHPEFFQTVYKKYKGDFSAFAEKTYAKTLFASEERSAKIVTALEKGNDEALKLIRDDPMTQYADQFREIYRLYINAENKRLVWEEKDLYKTYMAGLLEMSGDRQPYPDANRTMRLTYGKVEGYSPKDGVEYYHSTTMKGMIEKSKKGQADYLIPEKLLSLYETKDFGPYGVDGTLPLNFIASNHTSGGNSGSPVLDAEGRLIGINFDREWEGTMSDVFYDPNLCRNIAVDIRYILFIIDKFAGAGYLVEEMDVYSGE